MRQKMPTRLKIRTNIKALIYKDNDIVHYVVLAFIRIVLVFIPQFGYIHPDEFFQTIEVMAGNGLLSLISHCIMRFLFFLSGRIQNRRCSNVGVQSDVSDPKRSHSVHLLACPVKHLQPPFSLSLLLF